VKPQRLLGLSNPLRFVLGILLASFLSSSASAGTNRPQLDEIIPLGPCRGQVVDSNLEAILGVKIILTVEGGRVLARTQTDGTGQFIFKNIGPGQYTIKLSHPDFDETIQAFCGSNRGHSLLTLHRRRLHQAVTVTATRTPRTLRDTPSAVSVLREKELRQSPAMTIDDTLRQIPAFSLFRRTSSLVAHPTTQGVSLRGIGPSGVSRTLVLWDGSPLNDPFGGWIYWNQLDKNSLERIEVAAGGGSSLYGSAALGGVIQAFSKHPAQSGFELDVQGGSSGTAGADLLGSLRRGQWSGLFSSSFLRTDGYFVISPQDRGPVDRMANSQRYALRAAGFYQPSHKSNGNIRLEHFAEERDNGTALRGNASNITRLRVHYRRTTPQGHEWQVGSYGLMEKLDSSFTAVGVGRQSEFLTREQQVPARSAGSSVQWTGSLGDKHLLTSGIDWQWVKGNSEELAYRAGHPIQFQVVGGNQQLGGFYLQDLFSLTSRWQLQLGVRLDGWSNHDARRNQVSLLTGIPSTLEFSRRGGGMLSPKAGASFHFNESLSFRGSTYRSFRAPTLNELYRGFRVGSVVTLANETLQPESLKGIDAGLDWYSGSRISGRLTTFWNELDNAVSNITTKVSPTLITRQRQNVGRVSARGIEADLSVRLSQQWRLKGAYLLADSTFGHFPENPTVESNRLPQVARHRATASLNYDNPKVLSAFLLTRFVGLQFDDDKNQQPLGNYMLLDLHVSRRLHPAVTLTFSVENLLDRKYSVSNRLVEGIGAPRMIHSGLRLTW